MSADENTPPSLEAMPDEMHQHFERVKARHPLRHLWKPAPPAAPPWLQAARMIWHSDASVLEDQDRHPDETFNVAWARLFGEGWPEAVAGELTEVPDPIDKFETADALYSLFARGRVVIVYASSAMAICQTDVAPVPALEAPPVPALAPPPAAELEASPAAAADPTAEKP